MQIMPDENYDPTTVDRETALEYSKEEVRPAAPVGEQVTAVLHRPLRDLRPWVFLRHDGRRQPGP